jgi:hypothetical protein
LWPPFSEGLRAARDVRPRAQGKDEGETDENKSGFVD